MIADSEAQRDPGTGGPFGATVECGPYRQLTQVEGLGEREVTWGAFLALAALVDDADSDPDALAEFLTVTIEQTGQMWIYPTDAFLQNLLHRRGDQSKVRRALERLAPQEAGEESDNP